MDDISLNLILTDVNEQVTMAVENATLNYTIGQLNDRADATIVMARTTLDDINLGQSTIEQAIVNGDMQVVGDEEAFASFLSLLDVFDPYFNIVTP